MNTRDSGPAVPAVQPARAITSQPYIGMYHQVLTCVQDCKCSLTLANTGEHIQTFFCSPRTISATQFAEMAADREHAERSTKVDNYLGCYNTL